MNNEQEVNEELMQEAVRDGWTSIEDFEVQGKDPKDWVDYDEFARRGRAINPILNKRNKELQKELDRVKRDAAEAVAAAKEFREFTKVSFERQKAELQTELVQLREAKKAAITDNDGARVVAIEEAIDNVKEKQADLKEPVAPKQQPTEPKIDPILQSWLDKNEWFGTDEELTSGTNALGASIRASNPALVGEAFLTELDKRVRKTFHDKFGGVRREKGPDVEGQSKSRPSTGESSKHSYSNLPDEAKKACDMFIKQGLCKSREEYCSQYDWS